MSSFEPKFRITKDGWNERVPWTDRQCIILCLENCVMMAGQDKNQVERIIKELKAPRKFFANRLLRDDFDPKNVTCTVDDKEVDCASWDDEDMEDFPPL